MEATVVREYNTEGGRHIKELSDGRIVVSNTNEPSGTMLGTYAKIVGEVTEEKLAKAMEMVIEDVCRIIRRVANASEDFFIIKHMKDDITQETFTTVGHKFFLPTVKDFADLTGNTLIVK